MENGISYFTAHSATSDPGQYAHCFEHIPDDPAEICTLIQGLLIHAFWLEKYGVTRDQNKVFETIQLRSATEILQAIFSLNDSALTLARKPQERLATTCRGFSLLLCSILRTKNIPARLRCGFARYFEADHFEDHWICEYWHEAKRIWVMVDPQLDHLHMQHLDIIFDPLDVPDDQFLNAGASWQKYRAENINPEKFGVLHISGNGLIRANIVRDIFALNKVELLPWDSGWGVLQGDFYDSITETEKPYYDQLAQISRHTMLPEAKHAFSEDEKIKFPPNWNISFAPTIAQLSNSLS